MESQIDPFAVPMIFLRVGWMEHYQGIVGGDAISGGGAYVVEHGYGHEIFNFQPFDGVVYGYVQPSRGGHNRQGEAGINISRLGVSASSESVSGVLAIWVATARPPQRGAYVVGWYRNATVFRNWQPPIPQLGRQYAGHDFGYYVTAQSGDATRLSSDERVFSVPQKGQGAFGQSNVWYADDLEGHREFRLNVLQFIETRKPPQIPAATNHGMPRQADPFLRQRVEQAAIAIVRDYYAKLGYEVDSVERDNVGWDLNAIRDKRELKLEVKGLSGSDIVIQLTPNEYAMMQEHRDTYRVCVVSTALAEPTLEVFSYVPESRQWESASRRVLNVQTIIAAQCHVL